MVIDGVREKGKWSHDVGAVKALLDRREHDTGRRPHSTFNMRGDWGDETNPETRDQKHQRTEREVV